MIYWLFGLILGVSAFYKLVLPILKGERSFAGQVVLITGGGSGIGRLMALEFAKLKCQLVLVDINEKGIEAVAKEISALGEQKAHFYVCDVSDKDKVRALAQTVKKEVGMVNVLINNAGVVAGGLSWELKEEQMEKVMKVNALAPMYMVRNFLPDMVAANKGHLITMASAAMTYGIPRLADYCASKSAAFAFHEGVRLELKKMNKTGVKTLSVNPYYINTGMFDGARSDNPLLPILEPDYVVSQIMKAAKSDQEELFMPLIVPLPFLARFMFASEIRDRLTRLFGLHKTMDDFHGKRRV